MACDLAAFKNTFPELKYADRAGQDTLIGAKLAEATAIVDRSIYHSTDQADIATLYLAAHLMVTSPSGLNAKLISKDAASSIYLGVYDRFSRAAANLAGRVP